MSALQAEVLKGFRGEDCAYTQYGENEEIINGCILMLGPD
jgi:hypothetical protein